VAVALASAARATVAIATRYNTQRVVGNPGVLALEFPTHRHELASAVAQVYATSFYVDKVRHDFIEERLGRTPPSSGPIDASYAPWLAANRDRTLAKAAATIALEKVGATCRRLCGFQGVLHTNHITRYEDMARSFHAAGGDTRLLLLEAGKQLIKGTDTPAAGSARGVTLGDASSIFRLVSLQERSLATGLRHRAGDESLNDRLPDIESLARAHNVRRMLQEFAEGASRANGSWRSALEAAHGLYGIDVLLDSAAWHLNHGSLRPGDLDVLRRARTVAAEDTNRHLTTLIDGLAVPPGRAGAVIGRTDYITRVAALMKAR
jgi:acyl-CoA oxidase